MRQSCTSRCRGLTPLRGSSGKRERWASRSGERGCRGARLPPGSWDAPWHLLRAPFPSSPPRVLSGAGAGAGSCAEVQPAGVDVRESRRRWGRHTHTHTPPAPRIAGSPAASGPTWPGSGGARHPPAGRPDKAEGALPSRNGRGGGGGFPRPPRAAAGRGGWPPDGFARGASASAPAAGRGRGGPPGRAGVAPRGPPAAPPSPAARCSPIPPRQPGVPSHPTEILPLPPQPLPAPAARTGAGAGAGEGWRRGGPAGKGPGGQQPLANTHTVPSGRCSFAVATKDRE